MQRKNYTITTNHKMDKIDRPLNKKVATKMCYLSIIPVLINKLNRYSVSDCKISLTSEQKHRWKNSLLCFNQWLHEQCSFTSPPTQGPPAASAIHPAFCSMCLLNSEQQFSSVVMSSERHVSVW